MVTRGLRIRVRRLRRRLNVLGVVRDRRVVGREQCLLFDWRVRCCLCLCNRCLLSRRILWNLMVMRRYRLGLLLRLALTTLNGSVISRVVNVIGVNGRRLCVRGLKVMTRLRRLIILNWRIRG